MSAFLSVFALVLAAAALISLRRTRRLLRATQAKLQETERHLRDAGMIL